MGFGDVSASVIVNIGAFHLFLAPSGLAVPLVIVALEIFLARSYWSAFAPVVRARAVPDAADERASVGSHATAS
jgi:hypothetical protein